MSHWLILPILLPLFAGSLLLLPLAERWQRGLSLLAALALIPLSLLLIRTAASGDLSVYALGNWAAPFGIVLMLDRLAALMLLATAVLGSAALIYALRGEDRLGKHFHALFQFQLLGINGAFLTGDLFNLFVFFEILLIASYALLLHGGGAERVRSGLHYVILNLVGSAFFLIAVGTLYGLTGTLNMADMAQKIAMADAERAPLLAAAGLLLLVVFALKAALLPLYFWLPRAYATASAPVAALFAIMTKVGIYSILRVYTLVFGDAADRQDLLGAVLGVRRAGGRRAALGHPGGVAIRRAGSVQRGHLQRTGEPHRPPAQLPGQCQDHPDRGCGDPDHHQPALMTACRCRPGTGKALAASGNPWPGVAPEASERRLSVL